MATTLANLRAKLNGEVGVASDGESSPWTSAVRNNAIRDGYADLWRQGVWKAATQDIVAVSTSYVYSLAISGIRKLRRVDIIDSTGATVAYAKANVEDDGAGGYALVLPTPVADGYTLRVWGWRAYTAGLPDADPDRFIVSATMKVGAYTLAATTQPDGVARPIVAKVTKVVENDTMGTLAIVGTDALTAAQTETLTLNNGDTASGLTTSTKSFLTVTSMTGSGWVTGGTADTIMVGFGDPVDDLSDEYNRIPLLKAKAILYRQQLGMFARYAERQAVPPEMGVTVDQLLSIITASEREFAEQCRVLSNQRIRVGHPR